MFFEAVLSVMAGLLLGSFFNVCIFRIPRDLSVVWPRSCCPRCGSPIAWHDNVPVISFAVLQGKCRACAEPIAWRYPLVEVATALLFGLVAARYGWTLQGLKWAVFESLLMVLFWTDFEERILPDECTIGGSVAGLMFAAVVPVKGGLFDWVLPASYSVFHSLPAIRSVTIALLCGLAFSIPFWLLGRIYELLRQPDAFGLGDVKLLALIGVFLGWERGVEAVLIGFISGAICGVIYAVTTRQSIRSTSLPFGTFLCLGAAVAPLAF